MSVKRHSDFLALGFLTGVRVTGDLGLFLVDPSRLEAIAASMIYFLGMAFGTGRGFTQGDPTSPMIFNIVVDAVVRAVL